MFSLDQGSCSTDPVPKKVSPIAEVLSNFELVCLILSKFQQEDSPAEDSSAEDSPAEDSSAEDSPAEDSPAEDSSAEAPAEDSPVFCPQNFLKLLFILNYRGTLSPRDVSDSSVLISIVKPLWWEDTRSYRLNGGSLKLDVDVAIRELALAKAVVTAAKNQFEQTKRQHGATEAEAAAEAAAEDSSEDSSEENAQVKAAQAAEKFAVLKLKHISKQAAHQILLKLFEEQDAMLFRDPVIDSRDPITISLKPRCKVPRPGAMSQEEKALFQEKYDFWKYTSEVVNSILLALGVRGVFVTGYAGFASILFYMVAHVPVLTSQALGIGICLQVIGSGLALPALFCCREVVCLSRHSCVACRGEGSARDNLDEALGALYDSRSNPSSESSIQSEQFFSERRRIELELKESQGLLNRRMCCWPLELPPYEAPSNNNGDDFWSRYDRVNSRRTKAPAPVTTAPSNQKMTRESAGAPSQLSEPLLDVGSCF